VVIYTLWDAVFNSSKNLMKVGKDYIQCSWETTSPFWPLVHLDFLQTALSPLKGNLFPQDLRIYDFVPFIIVMCCRPMKSHPLNPVRPGQRRSWVILIRWFTFLLNIAEKSRQTKIILSSILFVDSSHCPCYSLITNTKIRNLTN
jgi:hypothetical protein